jgi:methionyl aminopeptidase
MAVFRTKERIQVKTLDQIRLMRAAGLVVAGALAELQRAASPGVSTLALDRLAEDYIRGHGAVPSFLGYPYTGENDFPGTICVSINDEIVHGIPSDRVLTVGDIVSIDCGAILNGWHGDAALTVAVGEVSEADQRLLEVTEGALWLGLAAARVGGRVGDISHAVEQAIRLAGSYGIVREYVGHGIGTEMHMHPQVPNYGAAGHGPHLVEGMALAVEPMANVGDRRTEVQADGWTVVTADGSRSAHFEHTVAVTSAGPWVLTAQDGGAARFAALGVPGGRDPDLA